MVGSQKCTTSATRATRTAATTATTNAFCMIRPPGHHAGFCGGTRQYDRSNDFHGHGSAECTHSSHSSNGFCLVNNVVAGLVHARLEWGVQRVAVIDIDAHFGNGTAELLKGDDDAFFGSVHLHEEEEDFFPGEALTHSHVGDFVQVAKARGGVGSAHTTPPIFRDCVNGESAEGDGESAEHRIPTFVSVGVAPVSQSEQQRVAEKVAAKAAGALNAGRASAEAPPLCETPSPTSTDSSSPSSSPIFSFLPTDPRPCPSPPPTSPWREGLASQIMPALKAFDPELIFISAGFDGLATDPLGGRLGLSVGDYAWATSILVEGSSDIASCRGRIVSVLEGGYDISPNTAGLRQAVEAHVVELMRGTR
jgi:acetoin utilization deacetylase AcuC-like enzyme